MAVKFTRVDLSKPMEPTLLLAFQQMREHPIRKRLADTKGLRVFRGIDSTTGKVVYSFRAPGDPAYNDT